MNNSDITHINNILKVSKSFYKTNVDLGAFIENFDVWINALSSSLDNLKPSLRGYWWDLEQVLAHAKYKSKKKLDDHDLKILNNSISNIIKMISESIEKYLRLSDSQIKILAQQVEIDPAGGIPVNQPFTARVKIDGRIVEVRGIVNDGELKIGTFYIPKE